MYSRLMKIISGGQKGIDLIGLEVAKSLGYETGGTAPKNYWTENGSDFILRDEFGLVESSEIGYEYRTLQNVLDATGTVILGNISSAGSAKTLLYCKQNHKPHIINPTWMELVHWINKNNIQILNIAGNRGSKLSQENADKYRSMLTQALIHLNQLV